MLKTVATALLLCAVGVGQAWAADAPFKVDAARTNHADRDAANWLSYGRTYSESATERDSLAEWYGKPQR